ncbi:M1 family aminopeptidase [Streptomyces sp. 8N706]|uniref:M1 family aminopeptidase n=1 Tax=Streptomyces sp. 8N706 TaxID=3457416 RepID=UPI003FD36F18
MEYPGLVLLSSARMAVAHEVAHQWWYGIVGNDQFREPWLDESFAVYAADVFRGDHRPGCWERVSWPRRDDAITRSMGHWARGGTGRESAWRTVVYVNGSCALHDLERKIGGPAMARLLRQYVRDHWHGVATTADFQRAARAATPQDLRAFWREHRIR